MKIHNKDQKGISSSFGILIIVIVAIVAVGGAFAYQYVWNTDEPIIEEPITENPQDETADWQTYRNEEYGYEIKYPKDWYEEESTARITVIRPWQRKEGEYSNPKEDLMIRVLYDEEMLNRYAKEIRLGLNENREDMIIGENYVGKTMCVLGDHHKNPEGKCVYRIIILEHNYFYEFTFFEEWSQINIAKKILSTFRFID